jgi:HAD superfamily hydrolase (TIGR01549 family)
MNALIFDSSGVLIDDLNPVWLAERKTLSFYGYDEPSLDRFRETFKLPISKYYESIGVKTNLEELDRKWQEVYKGYKSSIKLFPEVEDVLKKLKGSIKLGVSSATPDNLLKEQLSQFGIYEYFDAVSGSKDFREEKSEIILATLSKLRAKPESSAYVGDMEEDVIAGKEVGVYTIAVNREGAYHPIEKLKRHNPDCIITSLNDLLYIVPTMNISQKMLQI